MYGLLLEIKESSKYLQYIPATKAIRMRSDKCAIVRLAARIKELSNFDNKHCGKVVDPYAS